MYFFQWVHQVNDKTISHSYIYILIFYETRQTWIRTISEECTKKTKDKNDVPKSAQTKPKRIILLLFFFFTSSDDHFFDLEYFLTNAHNKLFSVCMFFLWFFTTYDFFLVVVVVLWITKWYFLFLLLWILSYVFLYFLWHCLPFFRCCCCCCCVFVSFFVFLMTQVPNRVWMMINSWLIFYIFF